MPWNGRWKNRRNARRPDLRPRANEWNPASNSTAKRRRSRYALRCPAFPEIVSAAKSWREKFEEIVFGRDLSLLASHPLVALEKDSAAAEQYRILREQVRTLRHETGARSISVTSPLKHDGKTMVAVNLAVAMALGGQERVLLIDGDLRDPDVHKFFGVPRYPGLADYLSSDYTGNLSSYVRPTSIPGLQIITAGKTSELAGELLAQQRMKSLMEKINSTYPDCQVIIDSSPVLATSDPLVLAREVGGVIMVVRAGKTRREYLKKAVDILNSPKLMGIVLNGAEFGMATQHYQYLSLEPES
jgi:capsular exopolysaccharide synthesis family protein